MLEPHRLLVRKALNESVSHDGEDVLEWLHDTVTRGTYRKEFFRNIEHLTRDAKGLIFWKEHLIGRFMLVNDAQDEQTAQNLAARCRELEAKGFPISSRALLSPEIQQAPADTPWKQALYTYAMFMEAADRVRVAFWGKNDRTMVILEKPPTGPLQCSRIEGQASPTLQKMLDKEGFECAYVGGYAEFERLIEKSTLTPADIERALANK
ncbi:MAG: hypothetical protein ACP5P4_09735 [Steroidobacteraceae bacterium]